MPIFIPASTLQVVLVDENDNYIDTTTVSGIRRLQTQMLTASGCKIALVDENGNYVTTVAAGDGVRRLQTEITTAAGCEIALVDSDGNNIGVVDDPFDSNIKRLQTEITTDSGCEFALVDDEGTHIGVIDDTVDSNIKRLQTETITAPGCEVAIVDEDGNNVEVKKEGKTVVGYGAPAKGNTLLNYCGIRTDFIDYTVDRSPHKQGHHLPGSHIPIYSPDKVAETKPDYLLILPWNIRDEIMTQMHHVKDWGCKFVTFIPEVQVA